MKFEMIKITNFYKFLEIVKSAETILVYCDAAQDFIVLNNNSKVWMLFDGWGHSTYSLDRVTQYAIIK